MMKYVAKYYFQQQKPSLCWQNISSFEAVGLYIHIDHIRSIPETSLQLEATQANHPGRVQWFSQYSM